MSKDTGLIYILTNPSFPNYQKIGKTTDLKTRLKSLNDKTCLPFSFRVYATYEIEDNLSMVEEEIFKIIDSVDDTLRAREENDKGGLRQREFFAIDKERAFSVFQSIARLRGDEDKLKLGKPTRKEKAEEVLAEEVEENSIRRKGERFSFASKGILIGAMLTFVEDENITVEVVSDLPPKVKFENKTWTLSGLTRELKHRNGTQTPSDSYQGAMYFTYNGIKLIQLEDIESN